MGDFAHEDVALGLAVEEGKGLGRGTRLLLLQLADYGGEGLALRRTQGTDARVEH